MFEVTKDEKNVYVKVVLKKRKVTKDKKIKIKTKQVLEFAKEEFKELKIKKTPEKEYILDNRTDNLEATWVFEILKEKKETKKQPLKKKVKPKTIQNLTKKKIPVTVEETEQSDQPAIVQEPTE